MNLAEKLLDREIFVSQEQLLQLAPDRRTELLRRIDTFSDEEIESFIQEKPKTYPPVQVLRSYTKKPQKRKYQDFVDHFNRRLEGLTAILKNRSELSGLQSISRVQKDMQVSIIGMVWETGETKNGHIILEVEDATGRIKVLASKNNPQLLKQAKDIMLDEVIGITGTCAGDIIFADQIIHPDVPMSHELKKAPDQAYCIFLSDLHFGMKDFYHKEWDFFVKWLNGEIGSETHRRVASKIKYFFIPGDVIEGVGIYPGQENDLDIKDVRKQYELFAQQIRRIRKDIHIIICPGNHDAGRLAEPQFNLYSDFTDEIFEAENITLVSNPATVRIHQTPTFPGFDVLIYHGYSFIYYGNNVPTIFEAGGVNKPEMIMKYLLTRRHLAPSHTSNLYIPDPAEDHLIIKDIPDFFISGHTHTSAAETYRGVTMINCSCWVPITDYQKNFGLDIQPGKVHLVDLHTRKVKEMGFVKEENFEVSPS